MKSCIADAEAAKHKKEVYCEGRIVQSVIVKSRQKRIFGVCKEFAMTQHDQHDQENTDSVKGGNMV